MCIDPRCFSNEEDIWKKVEEAANFLSRSHRGFLVECRMRTEAPKAVGQHHVNFPTCRY